MLRQAVAITASMLVLAGCAAPKTIPFNASQVGGLEQRTLVSVKQAAPGFMPTHASRAALGMVGAAMMISESKTYAADNSIADPSSLIEAALTQRLQESYKLKSGQDLDLMQATGKVPYPTAPGTLYVDAKVYNWGYIYFPMNWARYKINYGTIIQLIDGGNGTVVAQYNCSKVSHEDAATAPSLDELLANRSALMNSTLEGMAKTCVAEFEAAVFTA